MPLFRDAESQAAFLRGLGIEIVGRDLEYYAQTSSTNNLARERAQAGAAEGLVILAEEQVSGRGRLGRAWVAPPDTNLLFSLLLRPTWLEPEASFLLTMLVGVSLCEAVEGTTLVRAALKWPNDLMLPASGEPPLRKAAGILSELSIEQERVAWLVVGMGINVNWSPDSVIDGRDLSQTATNLRAAVGGAPIDRLMLLHRLLERLDERYRALRASRREELFKAWRNRLATLGQRVRVQLPGGALEGLAEDVGSSGALLVRDAAGVLHTVSTGDVGS